MRSTASLALLAVLLALAPPVHARAWRRPVAGPVTRAFAYGPDPFRRGWHRGVDLAAPPGAKVHAACSGRVVTARPFPAVGGVVTLSCGRWRVTHMPLAAIAVRPGAFVAAGERIGTLGSSRAHVGLHLGVRRAGDRFGYVDPLSFLAQADHAPPPIAVIPNGHDLGRDPHAAPPIAVAPDGHDLGAAPRAAVATPGRAPEATASAPRAATSTAPRAARSAAAPRAVLSGTTGAAERAAAVRGSGAALQPAASAGARPLAPWPAWVGLALALCGAAGGGLELRRRGGRRPARAAVREGIASSPP
jgi:Peptidase family M23